MKRFVQIIALVLVITILLAVSAGAENVDSKASAYFMSSSTYLDKVSSTTFDACFSVGAYGIMDELGASEIRIQRSADGITWTTVKTYTSDDYPSMICNNTGTHGGYVTYSNASSGYYYRARIDYYAKVGNGTGVYMDYTSSVRY